jgi:hypothetical protein
MTDDGEEIDLCGDVADDREKMSLCGDVTYIN